MAIPNKVPFFLMCGLIFTLVSILRRRQQLRIQYDQVQKVNQRRGLHSCPKPSWEYFIPLLHAQFQHFLMEASIARTHISEWYVKPRSLEWWNHYVGFVHADDKRFRTVFRLPLCLFQSIVELLRVQLQHSNIPRSLASIKGRVLSVEKQVAMGLFRLSTGTSMMAMSEMFGVGKSTVVESVDRFVVALLVYRRKYLAWPIDRVEIEKIKAGFFVNQGLPNVCGAMDATHIQMEKPLGELCLDWYDRNKDYSMLVQAVVDSDMRFLDVFAGIPGSVNDSRLLKNSAFYSCAERGLILNGPTYVHGPFLHTGNHCGRWGLPTASMVNEAIQHSLRPQQKSCLTTSYHLQELW